MNLVIGRPRLVYISTSSLSIRLMRGQLRYFHEAGFEVIVITSPGKELEEARKEEWIETIAVPMSREISPIEDLVSLWRLCRVVNWARPTITNVGTPKASLLGGIAAWINRVPCRVHSLWGLRSETLKGWKKIVGVLSERLAVSCAHEVICVSESLRQKAIQAGILKAEISEVPGNGSGNGVDTKEFMPRPKCARETEGLRLNLNIPVSVPVIGFVGRFTRDKGFSELIGAFECVCLHIPDARLLLVGDFEEGDPVPEDVKRRVLSNPAIVRVGFVDRPSLYYHAMDVVALPTYREGFPNVVLEAQASGKPVVTTNATGAMDSIIDGVTGFHVPVGNPSQLAQRLIQLLEQPSLRSSMGAAGRRRVEENFRREFVWASIFAIYTRLMASKGLRFDAAPRMQQKTEQAVQLTI